MAQIIKGNGGGGGGKLSNYVADVSYENWSDLDKAISGKKVYDKVSSMVTDIGNKQDKLTPGTGIDITSNVISTTALPGTTKYGASFVLSIDTSTYVVTAQLKDQDGNNLGTAQTIDLPLESVVVNGRYDDTTKKIILTLQNGNTIEFSVADLVSGLQTEITNDNKLSADLVDDTSTTNKFVTAAEKTTWGGKQDALTAGSGIDITSNTVSTASNFGKSTTAAATTQKEVSIPGIKELHEGQVVHILPSTTSTVANSTLKVNNFTAYPMRYNNAAITTSTDSIVRPANIVTSFVFDGTYWQFIGHGFDSNTTYSAMSVSEGKTGTATSSRAMRADYLKQIIEYHAPVQSVNGQTGAVTVTVPTKVSDLTNDSGFITSADVPTKTSDLTNDSGFITSSALSGYQTTANMVTSLANPDNDHYPTALAVSNAISSSGGGDVTGPASSTDGHLAVFNGNTGKIIKDGGPIPSYTASDFDIKDLADSTNLRTTWSGKQDALSTQTAYTSKGSATKVPQITTNSLGQVTGITEVNITHPSQVDDTAYASSWNGVTTVAPSKNAVYDKINAMDTTIAGKQATLATQTAYTSKGTATKVPTITTNTLGQVTAITETSITFPVTSVNGSTGAVTGLQTTANLKTSLTDNSDTYYPSQKAVKTAVDGKQNQHSTLSVTLTSAGWSSNTQTVTATGVTASNTVIVSPAPSSFSDYASAAIYCSSQASNSLTFTCTTEPTSDIMVNVLILN